MRPRAHPCRLATTILTLLGLLAAALPAPAAAATDDPALEGFARVWLRTDDPAVRGNRPFLWGPEPILSARYRITESLAGVPGGKRRVLYWDKARMEVNDASGDPRDQYYVTNGLLVAEMVTGRQQVGVNPARYAERAPAQVPFGDLDDPAGPIFASFGGHLADAPLAAGAPVAQGLDRAGRVGAADAAGVTCQAVVAETKHCIAAPFWAFLDSVGPVYADGKVAQGRLFDPPYYATGLPISEAYWITVRAGGRPARVLIQLFERRTLTYNPANAPASRVEMGNVGLEYYHWRYDAVLPTDGPTGLDPATRAAETAVWDAAPAYRYLIANLAGGRYGLIPQDLAALGALGLTVNDNHLILLDTGLLAQQTWLPARTLAHEAQHAYDYATAGGPASANECYAFELRGFLVESALWQGWYGPGGKPAPANLYEQNANGVLALIRDNPAKFVQGLVSAYREECGDRGPGSPERFLTTTGLPAGIADQLPVEQLFEALRSTINAGGPAPVAAHARAIPGNDLPLVAATRGARRASVALCRTRA